jgi:hypothetical protein
VGVSLNKNIPELAERRLYSMPFRQNVQALIADGDPAVMGFENHKVPLL